MDLPYLRLSRSRGKLDWRQRVLDFVRNAAGDVGPGRRALRGDEFSHVVQRNDIAALGIGRLFGGDADRQIAFAVLAVDRHLPLHQPLNTQLGVGKNLLQLRKDFRQRMTDNVGLQTVDQLLRRAD